MCAQQDRAKMTKKKIKKKASQGAKSRKCDHDDSESVFDVLFFFFFTFLACVTVLYTFCFSFLKE